MSSKLALGTVQFGQRYGIANQMGQVPVDEAAAILELARLHGIDTLDTAIGYGDSETRLGEVGLDGWQAITKLPPIAADCADPAAWVNQSVEQSLSRLRVPRLRGLLLHRARDLLESHGAALYGALENCRSAGLVEKTGVSIYDPEDLTELLSRYELGLVQAPFNVIDRRLATSGWLARLASRGVEVHVRSIFLQGLLLMNAAERPARFAPWQQLWQDWSQWLQSNSLTALQACLGFALAHPEISRVVVGVDGLAQMREIIASARPRATLPPASFMRDDPALINPLIWITT